MQSIWYKEGNGEKIIVMAIMQLRCSDTNESLQSNFTKLLRLLVLMTSTV